jgi:uncharacterized phage protein (TIGR02218 family)
MSAAQVSEANVSVLAKVASIARVSEANVSALVKIASGAQVQEVNISTLCYASPEATQRCDLWKITRRDGEVFAFTSLDSDFLWGGVVYQHCASLQDSASTNSSALGDTGSVTLTGLISSTEITDEALYGGLFDDAYVECWVVNWSPNGDVGAPFRTAAGWTGKVTRNENSYEAEVLGPGTRLAQTALVKFYTPGCRWQFGDSHCNKNAPALAISGLVITSSLQRFAIFFEGQAIPSEPAIWNNGFVTFTSGQNENVNCQTETVDWAAGAISLWDLIPYAPQPGDTFTITPGCSKDVAGCNTYSNFNNYGGFPDVPGPDSLQQNADALFGTGD